MSESERNLEQQRSMFANQVKMSEVSKEINRLLATIAPVRSLKSEFLGCTSYYYKECDDVIYAIDSRTGEICRPTDSKEEYEIRTLNALPISAALQEAHAAAVASAENLQRLIREDPLVTMRNTFHKLVNPDSAERT